jgi:hypothetical protein
MENKRQTMKKHVSKRKNSTTEYPPLNQATKNDFIFNLEKNCCIMFKALTRLPYLQTTVAHRLPSFALRVAAVRSAKAYPVHFNFSENKNRLPRNK